MQALLAVLPFWRSKRAPLADFELVGERVTLRPLREADAEAMFTFASDPQVTEFLPWYPSPDVEIVRGFIQQQVARRRRGDSLGLALLYKETGQMIGSTDIMHLKRGRKDTVEFGYILAREFWGLGLMSEAAALTVRYCFETLKRTTVVAWADNENNRSRRVLEKVGLRECGSEWREVKGVTRLYIRYELARTVWEERNA